MRYGKSLLIGLFTLILIVCAGNSSAQLRGRGQGFRICPYQPYQCPTPRKDLCRPLTITGKITQVLTETHKPGVYPGMAFLMESQKEGRVRVHLGPVWFLERQEVFFQPGDEVTVKGVCFKANGQTKLVAAQVIKGDHVLVLRDSQGQPLWEAWRKR